MQMSNSIYKNLSDIYNLKDLLYNEDITDSNGLPLIIRTNIVLIFFIIKVFTNRQKISYRYLLHKMVIEYYNSNHYIDF